MTRDNPDDLYELTSAPKPQTPLAPTAATPSPLRYERAENRDGFDPERLKNLHAPLALISGGLLVQAAATYWETPYGGIARAFRMIGFELLIGTVLMLLVFRWCASRRGFDFGKWSDAVLKVMAISVAPSAAIYLLGILRFIPFGFIVAWLAGFCFYFALIGYFFDLDQDDTWYCVIALFITRLAVAVAAVAVLT